MKKLSFLMAILVSLAMAFTACEKNPIGGETPGGNDTTATPNAEVTELTGMIIYKAEPIAYIFPSFNQFHFQGLTNGATYDPSTGDCSGSGLLVEVTQAFSYVENNLPLSTEFTPFEMTADNYIKEIFPGATGGVAIYEIANGVLDEKTFLSTRDFKVKLEIGKTSVKFTVECNVEGEEYLFSFDGTPLLADISKFWREAKDEGPKFEGAETYAQAEVIYYGETGIFPVNVIEVVLLSEDQTSFANFYCYGSLNDIKNVYGTFNVATEHKEGTMAKCPGLYLTEEGGYAYPSFVARNYSQSGADYYFVNAGSLTIEEGKISFDLSSLNGSKFTTNYTGNIAVKSYKEAYPNGAQKRAVVKQNAIKSQTFEVAPYNLLF
jgi:hypothetical protein